MSRSKRPTRTQPERLPINTYPPVYPPPPHANPTRTVSNFQTFPSKTAASPEVEAGSLPTRRRSTPPPDRWAKALAAAVLDARAGRRDPRSIQRWVRPDLFPILHPHPDLLPRSSTPAVARNARAQQVGPGAFEVAVTLWEHGRVRAVALRLEEQRGRWLATALELG